MSEEDVELVRGLLPPKGLDLAQVLRDDAAAEAWQSATAPLFHRDFECELFGVEGPTTYTGLEGLRAAWLDWLEPWASYRTDLDELIDAGDRVVALVRDHGRREGMTAEVEIIGASIWIVRDGKVARIGFYPDRSQAFEAAGMSEDDAHGSSPGE